MDGQTTAVESLGFASKLQTIFDRFDEFDSISVEIADMKDSDGQWYHTQIDTPYRYPIHPKERQRGHRPEVPEEMVDRLHEVVNNEYDSVPTNDLSFDENLKLYFEKVAEYYKMIGCHVIPKEKEAEA